MASSLDFVEYICDQLREAGTITYRKMFGEYTVYVNSKPIVLVCDNTAYVKMLDIIQQEMDQASTGYPYPGAKLHYILDADDQDTSLTVIRKLEEVIPLPKPKKKG
ncbi:MAG: TfoX/Sxy family protein [Rikenellaceae bacterium]